MTLPFLDSPKYWYKHPKKFFEKVDYRGCYSSIFEMGTALGKRGVATLILRQRQYHYHYFVPETW